MLTIIIIVSCFRIKHFKNKDNKNINLLSITIDQYRKNIVERLLPVIIQDFAGLISVKMRGGKMEAEEMEKFKEFKVMIGESNNRKYREELKT